MFSVSEIIALKIFWVVTFKNTTQFKPSKLFSCDKKMPRSLINASVQQLFGLLACRLKTIYLNKTRDWGKSQYSFASLSSSTSNAFRARFSSSFIARSSFTLANLRASCVQMQRNWWKIQGIRCEKILPWTTLSAIQKKEQEEFRQLPL
jgi:hypothetical protein